MSDKTATSTRTTITTTTITLTAGVTANVTTTTIMMIITVTSCRRRFYNIPQPLRIIGFSTVRSGQAKVKIKGKYSARHFQRQDGKRAAHVYSIGYFSAIDATRQRSADVDCGTDSGRQVLAGGRCVCPLGDGRGGWEGGACSVAKIAIILT